MRFPALLLVVATIAGCEVFAANEPEPFTAEHRFGALCGYSAEPCWQEIRPDRFDQIIRVPEVTTDIIERYSISVRYQEMHGEVIVLPNRAPIFSKYEITYSARAGEIALRIESPAGDSINASALTWGMLYINAVPRGHVN